MHLGRIASPPTTRRPSGSPRAIALGIVNEAVKIGAMTLISVFITTLPQ